MILSKERKKGRKQYGKDNMKLMKERMEGNNKKKIKCHS